MIMMIITMATVAMVTDNWSGVAGGDAGRVVGGNRVLATVVHRVEAATARDGTADSSPAPRPRHGTDEASRLGVRGRRDTVPTDGRHRNSTKFNRTQRLSAKTITAA